MVFGIRYGLDTALIGALVEELRNCGNRKDLQQGRLLHSNAIQSGRHRNIFVATTLISMYGKCGSMEEAREVFQKMARRNVVSWTALILGYVENGDGLLALEAFRSMDCPPNSITFLAALKACAVLAMADEELGKQEDCLQKGVWIHRQAMKLGFDKDLLVANTLVDMYSKCGDMVRARGVFDGLVKRNVVSWNALILGYVENGESLKALEMFSSMDCFPDRVTIVGAIKACSGFPDGSNKLETGMLVHRQAKELGFEEDAFVISSLVDMYSKCGEMTQARGVFDSAMEKHVVTWNALIGGYVDNGESLVALEMFWRMDCAARNPVTFVAALKACACLATSGTTSDEFCLREGVRIHAEATEAGFEGDVAVANTLVDMYSKCREMARARRVFEGMAMQRRTVVSWNALIHGYVENGECSVALEIFDTAMNCAPNPVTFVAALKACAGLASGNAFGKQICLRKGMIVHERAKDFGFDRVQVVANMLVDMYSKCGDMASARRVFEGMTHRDVVSCTALILGYVDNGNCFTALEIFNSMNCEPNRVTFAAAIKACAGLGVLEIGQRIHDRVCELGLEEDAMVANCLVDLYGKCGDMSRGEEVFNKISSPDVVSWNALIGGYSSCGDAERVFAAVERMSESGTRMNGVTMLLILTTCSHSGRVEEGQRFFDSMSKLEMEASLEHYSVVVDMLGRAKRLAEALAVVRRMPFEADGVVWTTLLGACAKWGDVCIGEVAFEALMKLDGVKEEEKSSACVLMRNMYERSRRRSIGSN